MTQEAAEAINRLVYVGSFFATVALIAYMFINMYDGRSAVVFFAQQEADVSYAAPGEIGTVALEFDMTRNNCVILPYRNIMVMQDRSGQHKINQRSAIPTVVPMGRHQNILEFEVPRLAEEGNAYIQIYGAFLCKSLLGERIVPYQSRPMPFNIMGN